MSFSSGIAKAPQKKCLNHKKCAKCFKKCDKINPEKKRGGRTYWQAREHWECTSKCFGTYFPRKKHTKRKKTKTRKKNKKTRKKNKKTKKIFDFLFT